MLNAVSDPSTNQNSASPQTPRTDIQSTNEQQRTASPSQASSVSQDQMQVEGLRVGNTTVQNSTSTPSNVILGHDILNAAWLWLIVPIALAIFLFKPQKKKPANTVAQAPASVVAVPAAKVQAPAKPETTESVEEPGQETVAATVVEPSVPASTSDKSETQAKPKKNKKSKKR